MKYSFAWNGGVGEVAFVEQCRNNSRKEHDKVSRSNCFAPFRLIYNRSEAIKVKFNFDTVRRIRWKLNWKTVANKFAITIEFLAKRWFVIE